MKIIYKIIFIGILLVQVILLGVSWFQQYELFPLKGAVEKIERPDFRWKNWFSEKYQENMTDRVQNRFAFRTFLIRLKNQIDYSFFDKINARNVVEGKEGYLYEQMYIDAYLGKDFVGDQKINNKLSKLNDLQDTLASLNKNLLVVIAAGKGSFYSEYFPDQYDKISKGKTNYEQFTQQLKKQNINHVDFNKWFLEMKDTSSFPLFPKKGIHWSSYGEFLVIDSLLTYFEKTLAVNLPDIVDLEIESKLPVHKRDKDILDGMNLLLPGDNSTYAYPKFKFDVNDKTQPKSLVIADSYYWGLYNLGLTKEVFSESEFWFYNKEIFPSKDSIDISDIDILEETLDKDIIILMGTEATLSNFSWGYIDELYKVFYPINFEDEIVKEEINKIISEIKNSEEWLKHVREKAEAKNILLDSMIRLDAIYMYENKIYSK